MGKTNWKTLMAAAFMPWATPLGVRAEEQRGRKMVQASMRACTHSGGLLAALLISTLGCGRTVPAEFGMYVYDGRTPIPLARGECASLDSSDSGRIHFIRATAAKPSSATATGLPGTSATDDAILLVHFKGLQPGNIRLRAAEYDLFVTDVRVPRDHPDFMKAELYEVRRQQFQLGMPTALLDRWLAPVVNTAWGLNWKPKLLGGDASTGLFRETSAPGADVELKVEPVPGKPDAYLLRPARPVAPGVYLLFVDGSDAGLVTQAKGAGLVRLGTASQVASQVEQGLAKALANLSRHKLAGLAATAPTTAR